MAISTKCPGCGKRLSGPDSAAGRKVKCPKCGQITQFPEGDAAANLAEAVGSTKPRKPSTGDLAQALSRKPEPTGAQEDQAAREGEESEAAKGETAVEEPPSPAPTAGPGQAPSRRSSTTMSRMLARSSPYKPLRLLGVIIYITGIVVAALVFIGGLVGLIVGSVAGMHPALAVGLFVGALVAAGVVLLMAMAASELIRLWADVGDRARHLTMMFEDTFTQQRADEPSDDGSG